MKKTPRRKSAVERRADQYGWISVILIIIWWLWIAATR